MAAVSVLIPVYNTEAYLRKCLDSITNQTLQDLEIICVDDGSTDGSADILQEYRRRDSRIRIVTKRNGGLPSARNAGLDAASGEYVGFVDSDDWIEPDMFRRLYEAAKEKDCDVVVCGAVPESGLLPREGAGTSNAFRKSDNPPEWLNRALSPKEGYYKKWKPKLLFKEIGTAPFLWRTLIKRELIEKNGLRLDETVTLGEDTAFLCKVYPAARGIMVLPDKLYHYCWNRAGSLMNGTEYRERERKARGHVRLAVSIAADWKERYGDAIMTKRAGAAFAEWILGLLYQDLIALPLRERMALARELKPVFERSRAGGIAGRHLRTLVHLSRAEKEGQRDMNGLRPETSVIIPAGEKKRDLKRAIQRLAGQKDHSQKKDRKDKNGGRAGEKDGMDERNGTEIILMDYRTGPGTDAYMERLLRTENRIRRCPASGDSLAECIREGMLLAQGKRIRILIPGEENPANAAAGSFREEPPECLLTDMLTALEEIKEEKKEGAEKREEEALYLWLTGEWMRRYLLSYCLHGRKEGKEAVILLIRIQSLFFRTEEEPESGGRPLLRLAAECLEVLEAAEGSDNARNRVSLV